MYRTIFYIFFLIFCNVGFCNQFSESSSCIKATFASSGNEYWKTIALTLTNQCSVAISFQNATITFLNTSALNTSFHGNFSPLSYPDNNLIITSQKQASGEYLAKMLLHFPTYQGSNAILPIGKSITLIYGAAKASYIPLSVKVYLGDTFGKISFSTSTLPTELNGYINKIAINVINNSTGSQTSTTLSFNNTVTVENLENNVSYHFNTDSINFNGYNCAPNFSPSFATASNSPPNINLSYTCTKINEDTTSVSRLIVYLPGWKTPPSAQEIYNAGYTHVLVAFGVFNTLNPGEITEAFDTVSASYIKSLQNLGIKVLLSLGGASSSIANTTVNFHQVLSAASSSDTFIQKFIGSLENLITKYSFDGFDFDIESGLIPSGTFTNPTGDIAVLSNIINTLHTKYPKLLLSLAPQTANISANSNFNEIWGNYASLIMKTYSSLDWVGIQLYNTGCMFGIDRVCYEPTNLNSPNFSVAMADDLLSNWPTNLGFNPYISYLKPSQIVLGYLIPNAQGSGDGSPIIPVPTIKRALQCLRTGISASTSCDTYVPRIGASNGILGGVFGWEVNFDKNNSYKFASGLRCVKTNTC